MNRRDFAAGGAALSIAATTGGVSAQSRPLAASLAVGGIGIISYLPLLAADKLGYFRDQGLSLTINDFQGGAKAVEALVGGSVDLTAGSFEHAIYLQAKGINVVAVALLATSYDLAIALSKKAKANYRSPRDVKGLKFGVTGPGSATAIALSIFLAKAGLTENDVSIIAVGGGAGAVAALRSGQIDGVVQSDPVLSELLRTGDIIAIVDTRKPSGLKELYGGPIAGTAILTTAAFAARNPVAVQRTVNGIVRALNWLQTTPPDRVADVVPPDLYNNDRDLYREEVRNDTPAFSRDGRMVAAYAANTYRVIATYGSLEKGKRIDVAATFTNSYVEDAIRHRGRV